MKTMTFYSDYGCTVNDNVTKTVIDTNTNTTDNVAISANNDTNDNNTVNAVATNSHSYRSVTEYQIPCLFSPYSLSFGRVIFIFLSTSFSFITLTRGEMVIINHALIDTSLQERSLLLASQF